ncbi:hypothetical protein BDW68DRAFT_167359 [Aspergillus falconensis]
MSLIHGTIHGGTREILETRLGLLFYLITVVQKINEWRLNLDVIISVVDVLGSALFSRSGERLTGCDNAP